MNRKHWLLLGGTTLLIFMLLYLFLIWPVQKKFKLSRAEVDNKTIVLRGFLTGPEGLPTKKEIGFLNNEIGILKEIYGDIEKALVHDAEEKVDITPVEFGKILYETKRDLLREAKDAGVEIPPDLGFKETLPTEEEVVDMVKELDAVTFVIREGIVSGFGDIKGIKYPGVETEDPWEKVGMELEVYGKFGDIVDFLCQLSQREKIYIIKSLEIKRGAGREKARILRPKLKGRLSERRIPAGEGRPKERSEVISLEQKAFGRVSVTVHLEAYNHIAAHGN